MTARGARSTIAPDTPSDRWYEHAVRRAPTLAPGEERTLTGMLDAHRAVVARDVLGSSHGLAYLADLAKALAARHVDVRSVVELKADTLLLWGVAPVRCEVDNDSIHSNDCGAGRSTG